jgi:WD40 repeat protein
VATRGGTIAILELDHGRPVAQLAAFSSAPDAAYHPLMDSLSAEEIASASSSGSIARVALLDDGRIAAGTNQSETAVFDAGSGKRLRTLASSLVSVHGSLHRAVVHGSMSPDLELWDLDAGKRVARLERGHLGTASAAPACLTGDGKHVVSGNEDGVVIIWDAQSGQRLHEVNAHQGSVLRIVLDAHGHAWTGGSRSPAVAATEVATGKVKKLQAGGPQQGGNFESMELHPSGWLAVRTGRSVEAWDTVAGARLAEWVCAENLGEMALGPSNRVAVDDLRGGLALLTLR